MAVNLAARIVLIAGVAACGLSPLSADAQSIAGDDFNSDSNEAWLSDYLYGRGEFFRTNGYLEYRVASPDLVNADEAYRPWGLTQPTYSMDWEVVVDVHNTATPSVVGQVATFGIDVLNANDFGDYAYVEIYASELYVPALRRGFKADLAVNGAELGENTALGDTGDQGFTMGSVRMSFDSGTKVLTAWFDRDGSANGHRWERLATFGINGVGGATTNANWGMTGNAAFNVALYGFSEGLVVSSGQVYGDNFFLQTAGTDLPTLSIRPVETDVELRWPGAAIGYELETSLTLVSATWTSAMRIPDLVNGTNVLRLPVDSQPRFFRLRK